MKFLFTFVILLGFSTFAQAKGLHECGTGSAANVTYKWCLDSEESEFTGDVLYFMHGGGGSEKTWQDADFDEIRESWKKRKIQSPLVISISFGSHWLLTTVDLPERPALLPIFVQQIMPTLEAKLGRPITSRLLMGPSMGGFNSSMLYLKTKNLFYRTALICPGVSTLGPFTPDTEVDEFLRQHPEARPDFVKGILEWTRHEFPTRSDWDLHDAHLLAQGLNSKSPELYVSCGDEDEYGFFDGAKLLAEMAKERKAPVTWEPLAGGHCVMNGKGIAEFLIP